MSMVTPRSRVQGLGSAKDGTHHWWMQRVTAIALIPLAILFLVTFVGALGSPYEEVVATYRSPWNAIIAVLFIGVAIYHLKLGLQVVIEDYVSDPAWRTGALLANILFCGLFGVAGIVGVLMLAFS